MPTQPAAALPAADADVHRQIQALHIALGDAPDVRSRDRAIAWLLAHADRSFPIALAQASATPRDAALIDLLGRYRRPETTPVLAQAFADDHARPYAAGALGLSPDPAARALLRGFLSSTRTSEVVAAIAGLGASGDPAVWVDVEPQLNAADAEVRWIAFDVAERLGVGDRAGFAERARQDPDAFVRELAPRFLEPRA